MDKCKNVVTIILTAFLIVLGAMLPMLVTALQDKAVQNHTAYANSSSVLLEFPSGESLSTVDKLILLNQNNCYPITEDDAKMDASQVLSLVQAHMAQYIDAELLHALDYSQYQIIPSICIDEATQAHFIVWAVYIENGDTDLLTAVVDDDTGIIFSVDYQTYEQRYDLTSDRHDHKIEAFMEVFLSQLDLQEMDANIAPIYEESASDSDIISRYYSLLDSKGREIIIVFHVTSRGCFYTDYQQ